MKKICLMFLVSISLNIFPQDRNQVSAVLPLTKMGNITQSYGQSTNFMTGEPWFHNGIDILTPMRTPVLSVMAGTVFKTGEDKSYGKYVIVDHNNKYKSLYAQLDEITAVKGQYVARGETIALSGNTGMSTGPHLHFSIYFENQAIDPLSILVFTGNQ